MVHAAHLVYRDVASRPNSPMVVAAHSATVDVMPSRTTRVDLGGTGRPLIGHVALPQGFDKGIDWSLGNLGSGGSTTSLKLEQDVPYPRPGMTAEAKAQWRAEWMKTDAGKSLQRAKRTYGLAINPDGTFRIDDVPSGTYTLTIAANWADSSAAASSRRWDRFNVR